MEKSFLIAGFGGQGVLLAGEVLANAFMYTGKNVTWYPSYGAEMRGGTVNCSIKMSDEEIGSVQDESADYIIVLNQASFDKFTPMVSKGGTIIVNTSLAKKEKTRDDINYVFAPITQMSEDHCGSVKMTNILSLGILSSNCGLVDLQSLEKALDTVIPPQKKNLLPLNIKALKAGYELLTSKV